MSELQYTGERQVHQIFSEIALDHRMRYFFASSLVQSGMKIADVGCGVGYGSYFLACMTDCSEVVGIDISEEAIAYAREYYTKNIINLRFECKDIVRGTEEKQYDLITAFEVIEHIDNPKQFISSLATMLEPDGIIVTSTPNQDVLKYDKAVFSYHKRHYTPQEFEAILSECGFEVVFAGSQNGTSVYAFPGNATNIFVCRKAGSVAYPQSLLQGAIEDTYLNRIMASYDLTGYCMDFMPYATPHTIYSICKLPEPSAEKLHEEIIWRTDRNFRKYYPSEFGDHPDFTNATRMLKTGDVIVFHFQAARSNLFQVSVLPTTYRSSFHGIIEFKIYNESGKCIAKRNVYSTRNKMTVIDGEFISVRFKEQMDSKGKKYSLRIKLRSKSEESKLSLYYDDRCDGSFSLNTDILPYSLTYKLYYN